MLRTGKWLVSISLGLLLVLAFASAQTASSSPPKTQVLPSASAQTASPHKKQVLPSASAHTASPHKTQVLPSASAHTGRTGQTAIPPKARHKARQAKALPPPVVLPPLPRGPLPQVPLEQLPTAPPQVNYQDGRLTIVAQNSTLSDILREVHKRTGASIDVPPTATEHVVARLGPAPAREVLATLLNGSSFNYVMVGSAADPAVLSSVVLTSRPAGVGVQTVQNVAQPVPVYTPPVRPGFGPAMGQPVGWSPTAVAPAVQPVPAVNPQAVNADSSVNDSQEAEDTIEQDETENQDQNAATPLPNAGPKTPDEMLQMLQRQQQQQQQQGQPPQPNPQD